MEEIKKEFEEQTSHLMDEHLRNAIWSWIEDKLLEAHLDGYNECFNENFTTE